MSCLFNSLLLGIFGGFLLLNGILQFKPRFQKRWKLQYFFMRRTFTSKTKIQISIKLVDHQLLFLKKLHTNMMLEKFILVSLSEMCNKRPKSALPVTQEFLAKFSVASWATAHLTSTVF